MGPLSLTPFLGTGLGYRRSIREFIFKQKLDLGFLEIMPEHFFEGTPESRIQLEEATRQFHTVTHGVSTNIGRATGANMEFVSRMARATKLWNSHWASDHLCFTGSPNFNIGQLTPLRYSKAQVDQLVKNVKSVADTFDRPYLLENVSRYFSYLDEDYSEPEVLTKLHKQTGCGILLDVTNLRNNEANVGLDIDDYLQGIPLEAVVQLHVAGSERVGGKLLDTHGTGIAASVWELATTIVDAAPVKAILIERDQDFETLDALRNEIQTSNKILEARQ